MKTPAKRSPLFAQLAAIAPCLAFGVSFSRDDSFRWDGDGPDPRDDGFDAYDVDVTCRAIVNGELVEGENSMGGHYSKPGEHDEDVSGYLPQMLEQAAEDLAGSLARAGIVDNVLYSRIEAARSHLKKHMRESYEAQRAEIAARG